MEQMSAVCTFWMSKDVDIWYVIVQACCNSAFVSYPVSFIANTAGGHLARSRLSIQVHWD